MKNFFFILITILLSISCGNKKNSQNGTEKSKNEFYVVSFFSKGEGVNSEAVTILEDYLVKSSHKIAYSKQNWGREGEVNYCFDISKTRKKKVKQLENEILALLKDQDLVNFSFDTKCK